MDAPEIISWARVFVLMVALAEVSCANETMFPVEVSSKVDRSITFEELTAKPTLSKTRTIEIAGQIIRSQIGHGGVEFLVRVLPIRTSPIYGPYDPGKAKGLAVIRFLGKVGPQDMQNGNVLIAIGSSEGIQNTDIDGASARRLTISAECFHVWRTQGDQLDEFPWLGHTRYWPLIEQTYCVGRPSLILPVS